MASNSDSKGRLRQVPGVRLLTTIVLAGVAARLFSLWIGRAEFTGWFNHTYYFFVQVRGLLQEGALPYPDMPLLFALYAGLARLLMAMGLDLEPAVVAATRLVMSVVPALVALPVYVCVRRLNGGALHGWRPWALVASAAFLPLSVSHLPEMLQKNAFGMLLLAIAIALAQRLLAAPTRRRVLACALLALVVALTHFGTLAALVLYGVALLCADAMVRSSSRRLVEGGLLLVGSSCVGLALVYLWDAHRFARVFEYAGEAIGGSLVASLWAARGSDGRLWATLGAVALVYGALLACYRHYRGCRATLTPAQATFWLAHIIYCALLILPLGDQLLMARLAVFASLPALVLLAHLEVEVKSRWARAAGTLVLVVGISVVAVGEVVSSRVHGGRQAEVMAELEALRAEVPLGQGDLVLSRTGVEHLSNWFFGVKAGVITALTTDDFDTYSRIFVLNPRDGAPVAGDLVGRSVETAAERYAVMRADILLPPSAEPVFVGEHLEVFALVGRPRQWLFDPSGRWAGYAAGLGRVPAASS